jgi:hypothetical protein
MMVVMALTLVIMTVLAQAFSMALNTFSEMRALGDMQQQLRTAAVLIRNDLSGVRFEGDRELSEPVLLESTQFPIAGFFSMKQGSPASTTPGANYFIEGTDSKGMQSARACDHFLYFTSRRWGNRQESFYTTYLQGSGAGLTGLPTALNLPAANYGTATMAAPGYYKSQWAEIAYYLQVNPQAAWAPPTDATGTPTKTYSLYRALFVMTPDNTNVTATIPNSAFPAYQGMACNKNPTTGKIDFYSPEWAARGVDKNGVTSQQRTLEPLTLNLPVDPTSTAADPQWARLTSNATLVLPNVISFQFKAMHLYEDKTHLIDLGGNPPGLYDTQRFYHPPHNMWRFKAIQITMRIWDTNSRQTRQTTLIQQF